MSISLKIPLILLTIIIAYSIYAVIWMRYHIAIGEKLADEVVPYEQHPPEPTMSILLVGDSSAAGTGAATPETSVAGYLGQRYPNADITNLGKNGARTHEVAPKLATLEGQRFDLVLIHAGGNDIVRFVPLDEVEKNVEAIITQAKQLSDNVIMLHGGDVGTARLFPVGTRWLLSWRTYKVRDIFLRLTEQPHVHYIDLWRKDDTDPFFTDPKRFYAADRFHPSADGYKDWFDHLEPVLQHIVPEKI